MSKRVQGFEAYEEIAIGLPNIYQCKNCGRLIHCMHAPEDGICGECAGVERPYEKPASRRLLKDFSMGCSVGTPATCELCKKDDKPSAARCPPHCFETYDTDQPQNCVWCGCPDPRVVKP